MSPERCVQNLAVGSSVTSNHIIFVFSLINISLLLSTHSLIIFPSLYYMPDTVPSTLHKLFLHLIDAVKKMELSSL